MRLVTLPGAGRSFGSSRGRAIPNIENRASTPGTAKMGCGLADARPARDAGLPAGATAAPDWSAAAGPSGSAAAAAAGACGRGAGLAAAALGACWGWWWSCSGPAIAGLAAIAITARSFVTCCRFAIGWSSLHPSWAAWTRTKPPRDR
jgi:hypothetical protein